ncbi:MAG: ThuA domain-containing protein [Verrucomicrobiales bacterium]
MKHPTILLFLALAALSLIQNAAAQIVYQGEGGIGAGKHIVLIASDHEYRSEETIPALARILARHYGFKCTVVFGVDPESGEIVPGISNVPGIEALADAELMVIFARFQDWPPEQMQSLVAYLERGGPVVGLRTATHSFKIPAEGTFAKYDYRYSGADYEKGFGRQVLGETWAGHYGKNHEQSTRLEIVGNNAGHPVMRGVTDVHVQSGGYFTEPVAGSIILAMTQPLNGMSADSPVDETKPPTPGAWVRTYKSPSGTPGRVFTTTAGASEDLLNEGFRRMLVNGCLWAIGLEGAIENDSEIAFVGPYHPNAFSGGKIPRGVKPADLAGWDSPIFAEDVEIIDRPKKQKAKKKAAEK